MVNRILGLRILAVASAVLAYFQASLGGIVRVSGSGEGCNGWPLCSGHPWPNPNIHSVIEFSHRTNGTLLGIATLGAFLLVVTSFRAERKWLWLSTIGLILVAFEGAVGGTVVIASLASFLVLFHFGMALIILAVLLTLAFSVMGERRGVPDPAWRRLLMATGAVTFVTLLSGSTVVATKADDSCLAWPLCGNGFEVNLNGVVSLNYVHRGLVLLTFLLVLYVTARALRQWGSVPGVRLVAALTLAVFLIQAADGLVLAVTREVGLFTALHVALAAAVWVAVVCLNLVSGRAEEPATARGQLALQRKPTT